MARIKKKKTRGSRLASLDNTREVHFILTRGSVAVLCCGNFFRPISRSSAGGTSPLAFLYLKKKPGASKKRQRLKEQHVKIITFR